MKPPKYSREEIRAEGLALLEIAQDDKALAESLATRSDIHTGLFEEMADIIREWKAGMSRPITGQDIVHLLGERCHHDPKDLEYFVEWILRSK